MSIQDGELADTIRFAMKATKELDLFDSPSRATAVEKLGVELGHEVARSLVSRKQEGIYTVLASFWSESGLGSMAAIQNNAAIIRLNNCLDRNLWRLGHAPAPCTFERSLLKTVFQDSLGARVHIDELECCKSGGPGCVFRLKVG